jgi:hypothetical protein
MNESKSIITQQPEPEYELLVSNISTLWQDAKNKAVLAINSELLMANWHTGNILWSLNKVEKLKLSMENSFL